MNKQLLLKHKFQFVSFCPVFHNREGGRSRIQVNDDFHLLHITRGTGAVFINHQRYALKKGVVISIPPFVEFYFNLNLPFEMLNIHYRVGLDNGDPLDAQAGLPLLFKPRAFAAIENLLRQMQAVTGDEITRHMTLAFMAHEIVSRHFLANPLEPKSGHVPDARIKQGFTLLASPRCLKYDAAEAAKVSRLSFSRKWTIDLCGLVGSKNKARWYSDENNNVIKYGKCCGNVFHQFG
ncbi:MAG: AraC family ligand binding domain-containing protein [Verrucomicrobia bacterium]|nr:AraC family ligand binding domain-containing protein [Verrucomicrobiota bacterium]MBU4291084.1 AraC family ligand binding domain-containing protein [Verrucomicrobiota bacterium]MBU4429366.1 AraC family ligand binding domain-containing protein [Verrucomicrobiota bacterium]MBU4498121.1 AraC family ligand binding domain-containing protein [Verrucomicrobiota bacterium]MCG2680101.1 AraC family ligand binding domain-containing protein [Kiritimatiellia bacterium]